MMEPLPDYANEFFSWERLPSIICRATDFFLECEFKWRGSALSQRPCHPQRLKFEKGGIRSAGNTSLGPLDLHFSRQHVRQRRIGRGRGTREGGRYSDIFHFVSNRGVAIRRITVVASPGKQVVAVRDRAFARARDWRKTYGKMQDFREGPRRVTLIECKCCGKPKLLIRFGTT